MFTPLFPIKNHRLFSLYEQAVSSFWTTSEIDLEKDDITVLSPGMLHMLKTVLSFFAASDIIVNENILKNFYDECVYPEAQLFYGIQLGMETVHTVMYNMLIDKYFDSAAKSDLFNGIETNVHIRRKADFCNSYMAKSLPLSERLLAYAAVEGIFFCSSFATIYFFKKKNLLPGLTLSNEFIARDESLHAKFSCQLYSELVKDKHLPAVAVERAHEIFNHAVNLEVEFVRDMLRYPVLGFTVPQMCDYVMCVANTLSTFLEYPGLKSNVKQPFEFMDLISLVSKANFFESRVSEYSKVRSARIFDTTADF
jgi:ribonucleotide reductase beta subunit family protein with ferritin-like domain